MSERQFTGGELLAMRWRAKATAHRQAALEGRTGADREQREREIEEHEYACMIGTFPPKDMP